MNKIKLTHVWDKLNDPEFTTIRSWNKEKEDYYRGCIGQEFSCWKVKNTFSYLPEYVICHAFLQDVQVLDPKRISMETLKKDTMLDGNVNSDWLYRIMKNKTVILLTFSKQRKGQQRLPIGRVC
jgi:hypothetical protein